MPEEKAGEQNANGWSCRYAEDIDITDQATETNDDEQQEQPVSA